MNDEYLLNRFIKNYKQDFNKIICSDHKFSLTWRDLFIHANNYAIDFKDLKQNLIPIIVDRSIDTPSAILACIIAKKTFVPISSDQPILRIQKILSQLEIEYLLNLGKIHFENEYKIIPRKNLKDLVQTKNLDISFSYLDPLYLLFTSGSTGIPKGVMVSHKNILNTLKWSINYQKWKENDIIGIPTNFGFDISLFDLLASLYNNVPHYIIKDNKDPFNSAKEIIDNKITSIFSSPSFFSSLIKSDLINILSKSSLRQIFSGGDFFPPEHMLKFKQDMPDLDIYNVWGPTETSIVNTMHKVCDKDLELALEQKKDISIGIMNHNLMQCFVIDEKRKFKIEEAGKIGEIVVTGESVSLGYLNNTGNNDFKKNNKKLFFTGDLGYFDDKFNLYIKGRKGFTVKVNGYRVNLKEIEIHAISYPSIHQAVAFCPLDYKNIIFIAIEMDNNLNQIIKFGELRAFLRKRLPSYMIPKEFIILKNFPKNVNGKIDRNLIQIEAIKIFQNK